MSSRIHSDRDASSPEGPSRPAAAGGEPDRRAAGIRRYVWQAPAWLISMLVHAIVLLAMALVVSQPPRRPVTRPITAPASDAADEFPEVALEIPDTVGGSADAASELAIDTELPEVPVDIVADAADTDAAPLTVEIADFGSETAPAADMMASIGNIGGVAGGLGGRAQAANLAAANGGGVDTEKAVDRALQWIAGHQLPDGGWSFDFRECPTCGGRCANSGTFPVADRCGATALALLPFLGRGYTHRAGTYQKTVEGGIAYLAALTVEGRGKAYQGGGSLYSQGLAGIALCECHAMTQDGRLAGPAQLALNHIMQAQDPVGGGWRYVPRQPGDTSVVGWQIMALKSGNMAGLTVDPLTVRKAVTFLNYVESEKGARYGYTDGGRSTASLTAVGLLCRMYLGWKKDNPALRDGVAYLARTGPTDNLYYDYYATQVMHHAAGDEWVGWNSRMKPLLLESQSREGHEAGSWYAGLDRGHGPEIAGRLYCTSLATMILEVYYRHLPIYGEQSVGEEFRE